MILQRGCNVWRVERADRMAVLIDGGAFFRAVREALLKARRSVFIVGWDLHSQTRLVGESDRADDGYPEILADFLSALVRERPKLTVRLLLWDYSVLYANERELFPRGGDVRRSGRDPVRVRTQRFVPVATVQVDDMRGPLDDVAGQDERDAFGERSLGFARKHPIEVLAVGR